ncbi:hypothetical protein [Streptomyces sp. NBC_01497]|uniref:hypothetical protein n=1 Tax=Streptomyces sp. NBC_01497 TaxID=2903885 RepID=UPI002E308D6B|nr:hypothetical protein [Streptomyces sp. NBC_01497]
MKATAPTARHTDGLLLAEPGGAAVRRAHAEKLKRGVHRSVQSLEHDIRTRLADSDEHARLFVWTKTADRILGKVAAY